MKYSLRYNLQYNLKTNLNKNKHENSWYKHLLLITVKILYFFVILSLLLSNSGPVFASEFIPVNDIHSVNQIENLSVFKTNKSPQMSSPRMDAIGSTAYTLGAQSGYVTELRALDKTLLKHQNSLNKTFNFSALSNLLSHGNKERYLLPPVIQRATNAIDTNQSGKYIKLADVIYKIIKPAQFITVKPTWQQYLLYDQHSLNIMYPDENLMPKTSDEKQIWKTNIYNGWHAGITQANTEMKKRITLLQRDFLGMILYDQLVIEGRIKQPNINTLHAGVAGDGENMHINQTTYVITHPAQLNLNTKSWRIIPIESFLLKMSKSINK